MTGPSKPTRRNDRAKAERQALGRRIRAHRLALGLTQVDICAHTVTGKAQMYSVESGNRDVLVGTLIDVAAAVGLEVALAAEHHLPLLDLTAAEVAALLGAARAYSLDTYDGETPALLTALDKLRTEG